MTSLLRRTPRSSSETPAATAARTAPDSPAAPDAPGPGAPGSPRTTRRRLGLVALATALVVLVTGTLAVARAHKQVTLDVDGQELAVATFAGSVEGLLAEQGVVVGEHDTVVPDAASDLADGGDVVVRHAQALTVARGGEETTVWSTSPSADEALVALGARDEDIALVASRSAATGRADIALRLDLDGPVDVVADGQTRTVTDGATSLDEALAGLGLTVGELDRVHVRHVVPADGGAARLTVVLQRVVVEERPTVTELPFETVTEQTADLYEGQTRTAVEGIPGERTVVDRVVLVDGAEESRRTLSDTVTREPVTQVVREGTKKRPVVVAAAPAAGAVVTGDVWGALARCESGGNPGAVSSNGLYYGLYQFSLSTWRAMGGSGLPTEASADEQTQRAQALQARSGWGQWPACAAKLGLL